MIIKRIFDDNGSELQEIIEKFLINFYLDWRNCEQKNI